MYENPTGGRPPGRAAVHAPARQERRTRQPPHAPCERGEHQHDGRLGWSEVDDRRRVAGRPRRACPRACRCGEIVTPVASAQLVPGAPARTAGAASHRIAATTTAPPTSASPPAVRRAPRSPATVPARPPVPRRRDRRATGRRRDSRAAGTRSRWRAARGSDHEPHGGEAGRARWR